MYCKNCGCKVDGDAQYCDSCGKVLEENEKEVIEKFIFLDENNNVMDIGSNHSKTSDKNKFLSFIKDAKYRKIVIISCIVVILIIVSILAICVKGSKEKSYSGNTMVVVDSDKLDTQDWTSAEFIFDGHKYKLNASYKLFEDNGWKFDPDKYDFDDQYTLIQGDKTSNSIELENKNHKNSQVTIGLINLNEDVKNIVDCDFWAFTIRNAGKDSGIKFILPGNIVNGSTYEDISKVYGALEEDKITKSSDSSIITYHYQKGNELYLDLDVDANKGLIGFSYMRY